VTALSIELRGLRDLSERLDRLVDPAEQQTLLATISEMIVSQTQERLASEKSTPSGAAWRARDPEYAARAPGSLLVASGQLLASLQARVSEAETSVGSDLPYAEAIHDGNAVIPARPYLGLSEANELSILDVVEDFFVEALS
jgi:phage gpG-like protein